MKITILFLYFFMFYTVVSAQNNYQVNTSTTNVNTINPNLWIQPLRYNTLKKGLRFMVLPAVKGSAYELNFKTKSAHQLLVKNFGGKIFEYQRWEDIPQKNGDIKRRFYFDCAGSTYFIEDYKPENESKVVNWNEPSIIWLDEIDVVKKKLEGKIAWINADSWKYELNGKKVYKDNPERFAKVMILQVGAGNYSNYPVRVLFKYEKDQRQYFIEGCVSGTLGSCFSSENLNDLFSFAPPETQYSDARKEYLLAIKNREIKKGMNEAECYLSLGKPNSKDTKTTGKDKIVELKYDATDLKPYYLSILLKNNSVIEIYKSE